MAAWEGTRDTLHLWTQVVGKVRLALAPAENHWWQVPLYVNARGLTTSLMPVRGGLGVVFDFSDHQLLVSTTRGADRRMVLEPRSVADFHREFRAHLDDLGVDVRISRTPVEVIEAIPFDEDHAHDSYDADAAPVLDLAGERPPGPERLPRPVPRQGQPVHFFWGAFDLATTRFSGRAAPRHPGGVPNCPDRVMTEAYSEEVSSCGYWPGGATEGVFYAYSYPEPPGYRQHAVEPTAAFDDVLGEFVLPYADVRTQRTRTSCCSGSSPPPMTPRRPRPLARGRPRSDRRLFTGPAVARPIGPRSAPPHGRTAPGEGVDAGGDQ